MRYAETHETNRPAAEPPARPPLPFAPAEREARVRHSGRATTPLSTADTHDHPFLNKLICHTGHSDNPLLDSRHLARRGDHSHHPFLD